MRQQPAATLVDQETGVAGLVVVHRRRERHKQGGGAHGGNLGHGAGTGAADHQVGIGKGLGRVVDKRGERGLHTGGGVVGAQLVDLLLAAWWVTTGRCASGISASACGTTVLSARAPRLPPTTKHLERATAAGKARIGRGLVQKFGAQRVAHPLGFFQHVREGGEHTVGHAGQHLVGHAGDRVLLMQHQGLAAQHAHHAAREGDVAAQAHHHIRLDAAHHLQALPEGAQQLEGQQHQRLEALAAHAAKSPPAPAECRGRHDAAFHAAGCAQPVHAPALVPQGLRHGQAREDMAARAARHDECALLRHTRPPCMSCLFS